ncbi:hypothetical protein HZD82_27885, partial [Pantoea agglomerans]|nr:hypothetical protein [Pantoea agglomerans]
CDSAENSFQAKEEQAGGYPGSVAGQAAYLHDLIKAVLAVPFFIAAPLGLFGLYVRLKLEETPAFQQHMEKQEALEQSK